MTLANRKRTKQEQKLRLATLTGALVDLRTGQPRADDPACGATWEQPRTVRAELLAELLTQHGEGSRRPRMLRLAGARIIGVLNLEGVELICPLLVYGCWFDEPIILAEAQAVTIRLPGCHLPAIQAAQLVTRGNLELDEGLTVQGEIDLVGAHIGGTLSFSGATLTNPDGPALNAEGLTASQGLFCREGFTAHGDVQLRGAHINGPAVLSGATVNEGEVNLRGAHIQGTLDLARATLTNPRGYALNADRLTVDESVVCSGGFTAEGEIDLMGARIGGVLTFAGATLTNASGCALNAARLTVEQDVFCTDGFTVDGEVRLLGARIGGDLHFAGRATLRNSTGPALYANRLTVGLSMFCRDGFTAHGEMRLLGAQIRRRLSFATATLTNPGGIALQAEQLTVDQDLFFTEGFGAHGEVRLPGAHIGGTLSFIGATLTKADGETGQHRPALTADRLTVKQSMLCSDGFTAVGEVDLRGAHIGGNLLFDGATLTNPSGRALSAAQLTVEQSMFCTEDFRAEGEVRLRGARVGGDLEFAGATLTNPTGYALSAARLTVAQDMLCGTETKEGQLRKLTAEGEVRLAGAQIGGTLDFAGATLTNPSRYALDAAGLRVQQDVVCTQGFTAHGELGLHSASIGGRLDFRGAALVNGGGDALVADALTVSHSMLCSEGFTAEGRISVGGAHVGGRLSFTGATLTNRGGPALYADGLTVDKDLFFTDGFAAHGQVSLSGAHINGQLDFTRATLADPDRVALNLEAIQVPVLLLRPQTEPSDVNLSHAQVGVLADDQATWPRKLTLAGFTYDALHEHPAVSAAARLSWLHRNADGYTPQPYEQLAATYRRAGREEDARRVAIAKQRQRRRGLRLPGRLWSLLLDALVGYGYRTWLAGVWLLAWVAVGTLVYDQAYPAHMRPAKPQEPGPGFQPVVYALDVLLPVVDLDQQAHWIPQGMARWWTWTSILAGWVLTTAVVAALTGLLKRE